MSKPRPVHRYVVFFTPRSGSSRLADLSIRTGVLGEPGECFNPLLMPGIARGYSARNMAEYIELVARQRNTGGVFGCQVTYSHIVNSFRTGRRFLSALKPDSALWLIREDIVAQAVSATRMMQTKVHHAVHADKDGLSRSEAEFVYDPAGIRRALRLMMWMEGRSEALFSRHGLSPLRLSYERSIAEDPAALMARIAAHVGAGDIPEGALTSGHSKLPGNKASEFAERFRAEHPGLVRRIDRRRSPMLAALRKA